ncbi:MAG: 1-acyl-sn-glycerol-3-phosphate acyltransferase, partial [Deltaproteobacteria bacterium]|nr:1-acyl-sn-glycerol-3-phosphate acyltransferase [Deltaproteobacteria bacterium]
MWRTFRFWTVMVLYTFSIGIPIIVFSLVTFGVFKHWIIRNIGPLWGKVAFLLAGVKFRFLGREWVAERTPQVLILNHASTLDLFVGACMRLPAVATVGKIELWRTPVLGQAFALLGFVFIDRGDHQGAMRSLRKLLAKVRRQRLTVAFAPEGTRSKTGKLLPFKVGAFLMAREADIPVVPLVIHGAWNLLRPGEWTVRPGELVAEVKAPRKIP